MPRPEVLRWLDQHGAAFLCRCLALATRGRRWRGSREDRSPGVESIVIVKFCCLGDAILMGPGLRAICAAYPAAHITVITTPKTSGVFPRLAQLDRVVELPLSPNPLKLWRTLLKAVPAGPDLLYCFEPWYPTATLVSWFLRPTYSIGFTSPRAPYNSAFFDVAVAYNEDRHVVETYRRLAEAGIPGEAPQEALGLSILEEEDERVGRFFGDRQLGGDVVALFAGGSPRWLRKRWPASQFAALADRIASELGMRILLLTGRGQESVNQEIIAHMRGKATIAPGDFSVAELAAVIRRCRLLVSSDSSPVHIASAVGTPVVAMFGPVPSVTYHPYLPPARFQVVSSRLPCSPCVFYAESAPCPIDFECVRCIKVDDVMTAVRLLAAAEKLTVPLQCVS